MSEAGPRSKESSSDPTTLNTRDQAWAHRDSVNLPVDDGIGRMAESSRPGPANASTSGSQTAFPTGRGPLTLPYRREPGPASYVTENGDYVRSVTPARDRRVSSGLRSLNGEAALNNRASRLLGLSSSVPPPPPGPPPSEPPPLPPSAHPFAQPTTSSSSSHHSHASRTLSKGSTGIASSSSSTRSGGPPHTPDNRTSRAIINSGPLDRPPLSPRASSLTHQQSQATPPHTSSSRSPEAQRPNTLASRADGSSEQPRTPSRLLLQSALDLAQKAVDLDRVNDVAGALEKYREAVTRLRSVMERVGIEPGPAPAGVPSSTEDPTARRRRSAAGRGEEEGRTLRGIHDAYVARIGLLLGFQAEEEEAAMYVKRNEAGQSRHPYGTRLEHGTRLSSEDVPGVGIGNAMLADHASPSAKQPTARRRTMSSARRSMDLLADGASDAPTTQAGSLSVPPLVREISHESMSFEQALVRGPVADYRGHHPQSSTGHSSPQPSLSSQSARAEAVARRESLVSSLGLGPSPSQSLPFPRHDVPPSPSRSRHRKKESIGLDVELEEKEEKENMEVLALTPRLEALDGGLAHMYSPDEPRSRTMSGGSRLGKSLTSSVHSSRTSLSSMVDERPLPPLPGANGSIGTTNRQGIAARKTSLGAASSTSGRASIPVSPTTSQGTINHRRQGQSDETSISSMGDLFKGFGSLGRGKPPPLTVTEELDTTSIGSTSPDAVPSSAGSKGSMTAVSGLPTSNSRLRAASQPNQHTSLPFRQPSTTPNSYTPPIPSMERKASHQTPHSSDHGHLRIVTDRGTPSPASTLTASRYGDIDSPTRRLLTDRALPLPPNEVFPSTSTGASASMLLGTGTQHGSLMSPLPEPVPTLLLHRPFHLLRQLRSTIISPSGGYATRRLHIPREVWSQGGAKLASLETKVKVVELLVFQLKTVEAAGMGFLLDNHGVAHGRAAHQDFVKALDDLDGLFDECQKMLAKKLGLTLVGTKGKKLAGTGMANWGNKFARSLDRIANGKNLDSPTVYVDALNKLCQSSQILDQHLMAFTGTETPAYADLKPTVRGHIELRLRRSSEFFGSWIVPFVVEDLKTLLFKYLKHGNRWLDE